MKKGVIIGCSAVLVVLVVAGAFAWFRLLAPAIKAGSELVDMARQVEQLQALNGSVRNQSAFSAPADGALSPAQVQAVLAVQSDIRNGMAERLGDLEARYRRLDAEMKSSGRKPGIDELASAYSDLFALLVDAKRLQVESLNRQGLSLAEYQWARAATLHAAGLSASGVLQLESSLQEQIRVSQNVPQRNLELVKPHASTLLESAVIASLGL